MACSLPSRLKPLIHKLPQNWVGVEFDRFRKIVETANQQAKVARHSS